MCLDAKCSWPTLFVFNCPQFFAAMLQPKMKSEDNPKFVASSTVSVYLKLSSVTGKLSYIMWKKLRIG